ncbi:MAG: rod shape-determining protein MreC [Candidatus Kerfeldbacteria bacterium]|nr:rod shape-determining protein MreC [Candidatus Kerfeldbacteria bacterium]
MKFFRDQARQLGLVLGVILIAVVLYYAGWLRPVEHWASTVAQPWLGLAYATIDSYSPLYSTTDSTLLAENRTLKDQLTSVVQQNQDLQVQLQQYDDYQAELKFAQQREYTILPAKVTTRLGSSTVGQWLYINRGSTDGIAVGYPVIYGPGMLLGVVDTVHESYSQVELLTNDGTTIQGQTQTTAATTGILQGQFGTSLMMNYIVKDQPIAVGDVIVTNDQDRLIPAGFIIGTVGQVTDEPSELFKSALVNPMVRYGNNAIVSVVLPTGL